MDKINSIEDLEQLQKEYENIVKGQEMVTNLFDTVLKRFNVVQFDPIGEKFDPNIHEAMFMMPSDEHPDEHIGNVVQTGWKIGDRVLRAAKCGVVKK